MATSTPQAEKIAPIVTSTHPATAPLRIVVVGAGGTGGRLIPPLMQVLRRGDSVAVVDADHVEDRNLTRQNFRTRDVGENKADVMVRRYRREHIAMDAYAAMLTAENWREIVPRVGASRYILMGCVDNWQARQTMNGINREVESIWIDGGNERRGGQVLVSAHHWPCKVKGMSYHNTMNERTAHYDIRGINAMPQLLKALQWHCDRCDVDNAPGSALCTACHQPEASCRDRIDLQTVAVNQMSATCMLNALSCILYQVPFSACGSFFSTLNTMSPILMETIRWDYSEILPEQTYVNV